VLAGRHVILDELTLAHVDGLVAAAAEDPSLYQWNGTPQGEPAMRTYVEHALEGRRDGHMLPFVIRRAADGSIVGSTRFARIERWGGSEDPSVCEIGYTWLARSAVRTGVNTEAKLLLLDHAFSTWHVHRVSIVTDVRNEVSRRAIERLGARCEGVIRAERLGRDGTVRDTARYSIIASEWPRLREPLAARAAR
jgi:RimJ/RimL family protein N-acetyltransferase